MKGYKRRKFYSGNMNPNQQGTNTWHTMMSKKNGEKLHKNSAFYFSEPDESQNVMIIKEMYDSYYCVCVY